MPCSGCGCPPTAVNAVSGLTDSVEWPHWVVPPFEPHRSCVVNGETLSALAALAEALERYPEDLKALQDYGNLPNLILDVLDDWIPEEDAA